MCVFSYRYFLSVVYVSLLRSWPLQVDLPYLGIAYIEKSSPCDDCSFLKNVCYYWIVLAYTYCVHIKRDFHTKKITIALICIQLKNKRKTFGDQMWYGQVLLLLMKADQVIFITSLLLDICYSLLSQYFIMEI